MQIVLIIIIIILALLCYLYYRHRFFTYWKKKGVPTYPPKFPAGNITDILLGKEHVYTCIANFYTKLKNEGHKHAGLYFFNGPVYLPIDREIIKSILTTDFEYFTDRGVFLDEDNFPLSGHLFALRGSKWKTLRQKLTPTFSSGKLKAMYDVFLKIIENFVNTVETNAQKEGEINIKHTAMNFSTDIILATAFGLNSNTLKEPDNELAKSVLTFFKPSNWIFLKAVTKEGFSNPGNLLRVIMSNKPHETFFMKLVKDAIDYRDKNNIVRNDFLSLLLEVRDKEGLSFNEIAAQCFVILFAGFETSAQSISYCIHHLAHSQDCQEKLRKEIFDNLGQDFTQFTYAGIKALPYLDRAFQRYPLTVSTRNNITVIVSETLRMYPTLGYLNRICVKPYKVPGTDVVLDAGTPVLISHLGIQRDPEYFPEPLKFDPDRFKDEDQILPFSFLPFGEGPRFCIASRYGTIQTKLAIAALVSQFRFYPSPKTPETIEFDNESCFAW
ncbi:cytochrome P450 6a2-like isoform X2 [Zophobas morio]|uniref:cytochrome P450 6a2-like isoform X2 n=1 Tax=Zophobas morio TaxID=2755281 RepID=UPI003082B295